MDCNILKNFKVFDGIEEELLNRVKLLFVFRSNEVLFSTINDEVYALGGNEYGCLGTGNDEALSEPTKIYELCENKIIEIVAGHHHMMALTETGKVYTWGRNECGQLGHDEINTDIHKPKIVSDLIRENIISICSGYSHSLALSDNGEIFSWGSNKWGEVGSGKEDLYHLKPIRLKGFDRDKVSVICCGLHHSLALTEKGKVFTWGSGWLRENEISEPRSPKIVRVLNESRDVAIKKIACGKEHCFLLSEHYEIYAFGKNSWDFKNFISEFVPYQQIVKLENYLENISKWEFEEIAASTESNISIGLLFDGTFVIWGEFDECKDKFPRTTKLKSFQDIFLAYSTEKFTYKKYLFNELVIPKEPTDDEIYNSEYKELSTLQSGKYGVVCKAKNIYENSEVYAIKKIPIESKLIEKSIKIIENLSKLKSDFVVNYLKVWIEDNYFIREDSCYFSDDLESCSQYTKVFKLRGSHLLHIQMELCFGTLRFAIDQLKKEIDPETSEMMNKVNYFILCELLTEILEGLNYLHEQDNPITHRYLDPDEILITYGLNGIFIKIADFSCKLIHVDHHEEMIPRKVYRYMAPEIMDLLDKEVVANSRYYDTKADIYSLGQIMKEMFFHYINDYIRITANEKIDINSNIDSPFKVKTKRLFEVVTDMLHPFAKFRPNCQKIQDEKNQWCSGLNDPDVLAEFNEFKLNYSSIWEIQDSFYLYFLKKKIESAMKNQNKIDRRISILIDFRKDGKYENDFNENTLISYGTFGVVCKVQEKLSNTEFAIKMTPIKQDYDQQSIREIAIITKLNPDYVVKCKSIWIEDRYDLFEKHMKKCKSKSTLIDNHSIEKSYVLFIQMELCFLTLKDAIEKINNELKQKIFPRMTRVGYYIACELMIELFEGVNYLHKLVPAVIHRDLKPSNILISFGTNGRFVKIADFGLSTLHVEDDQSHTIGTGTKRYMAPEVETKRKYDTRSDIYSLGLILKYVFNFELKNNNATSFSRILTSEKYENLEKLQATMVNEDFNQRPNCELILKNTSKWRLNLEEILKEQLVSNLESNPPEKIESNLSGFIICSRLKQLETRF